MRPILLKGHKGPLTCVKYNKDGDLLFTTCRRGGVNLWYSDDGERIGNYKVSDNPAAVMYADVNFACTRLATASMDSTARIWDVETGKVLRELKTQAGNRCASFATGDKRIAVLTDQWGDQPCCIQIFDTESGEGPVMRIPMDVGVAKATRALWGPLNKKLLVSNESGGLLSYDAASGECLIERCDFEQEIPDFTFSQDLMTFIVASKDHTAMLYDTETLEPIRKYVSDRPINSAAISPLMDHVVIGGGQDASAVTTTAGRSGRFQALFYHKIFEHEIGSVQGHFGPINSLAFNPDGRSFTSGGEDGYVRVHHFDPEYFSLE